MNSPIASLAEKASVESATAGKAVTTGGQQITGQWLFDNFVKPNEAELTKMTLLRGTLIHLPLTAFSNAVNGMVDCGKEADKAKFGESSKEHPKPQPSTKTAQNHRTVLRNLYGALKYAETELRATGYTDEMGYIASSKLAPIALQAKGIKWDGYVPLSADQKARKATDKVEEEAMTQARVEMPREDGEKTIDWTMRIAARADAIKDELVAKERTDRLNARAVKLVEELGVDDAMDLSEIIQTICCNVTPVTEEKAE